MKNKVAILSTGSELITGDILNTNAQYTANILDDHGFSVGMHLAVTDDKEQIEQAMRFLLTNHRNIIVTGGLGPTSDDLTRFALAEVIQKPLTFFPPSWDRIVEHFRKNQKDCPENNRVQALFPENSEIFPNAHGTADGCAASINKQWFYLLPGPTREFKPILNDYVMPHLLKQNIHESTFRISWLLLNVSEGHIAQTLDPLLPSMPHSALAYRVHYPYLEIKLRSNNKLQFQIDSKIIESKIHPYIISLDKKSASEQLRQYIKAIKKFILIEDTATGGVLESLILDEENYKYLRFSNTDRNNGRIDYKLSIKGLDDFWETPTHPADFTNIHLTITHETQTKNFEPMVVRVYGKNPRNYAAEISAWQILCYLKEQRHETFK